MGKIGEMGERGKISPLAFYLLTTTPVASSWALSAIAHCLRNALASLLTTLIASYRGSVASLLGVLELG